MTMFISSLRLSSHVERLSNDNAAVNPLYIKRIHNVFIPTLFSCSHSIVYLFCCATRADKITFLALSYGRTLHKLEHIRNTKDIAQTKKNHYDYVACISQFRCELHLELLEMLGEHVSDERGWSHLVQDFNVKPLHLRCREKR